MSPAWGQLSCSFLPVTPVNFVLLDTLLDSLDSAGCFRGWQCHAVSCSLGPMIIYPSLAAAGSSPKLTVLSGLSLLLWCGGRMCMHTCNFRSPAECLCSHPISERSASTPDRRRRPGSAPGPPAPALRQLGPVLRRPAPSLSLNRPSSSMPSLHSGLTLSQEDPSAP
jgi:hypothetical protein